MATAIPTLPAAGVNGKIAREKINAMIARGDRLDTEVAALKVSGNAHDSTTRPAKPVVGQWYFDTTVGKPIWCKDATLGAIVWVDGAGTTI